MTIKSRKYTIALVLMALVGNCNAEQVKQTHDSLFADTWRTIKEDHSEFYSSKRLTRFAVGTAIAATLANTSADKSLQNWFQNDVRSDRTNSMASASKNFGDYKHVLPAILISGFAGSYLETRFQHSAIGNWGKRSMRAYLLGVPMLWSSQIFTGASRPGENSGSGWQSFNDNNGVSGHAFTGAVPFLTMARLNEDNIYLKTLFYAASTLTAISRINDNAHYFSQAALGWLLAWEATDAVADNDYRRERLRIKAMQVKDGYGLQIGMRW